jgi:hypothetical protein
MATEQKRRTALLAILLALLAAGTLCVWGAAAAGFSFSSPALSAAIDAFNNTRAGNGDVNSNGGGDVNISLPGGGGNGGGDGDTGDGGEGDTGSGGEGNGGDAGGSNCFLGVLCLNVDGDGVDADVDGVHAEDVNGVDGLSADVAGSSDGSLLGLAANAQGDKAGGLNIGGLHINATGDADDSEAALAAAGTATGNEEGSCFLNLVCLTANADGSTNDVTNANVDANVHDEDEDLNVDVLGDGTTNTDTDSESFLDSILNVFAGADSN